MKKICIISVITFLALGNIFQFAFNHFIHRFSGDAVPTKEVALEVGKAVLAGAYGEGVLNLEPFNVQQYYSTNAWVVYGTLPDGLGSIPIVVINKRDGKILKLVMGSF